MKIVTNEKQIIENIRKFNNELNSHADGNINIETNTLINNIPHYRAWYCIYDTKSKKYLFAPSKYIGYKDMSALIYHKKNRAGMDGRKTESTLTTWYEQISSSHPDYMKLSEKLRTFCSQYGKKPNSLFRIHIVLDITKKDSREDEITELIWKVYLGLSKNNKTVLKARINKTKI